MTDSHRLWVTQAYQQDWQTSDNKNIQLFKPTDFAYHKVSVVFWQTDEHEQPAFITEPYNKSFTPATVKKEQQFYDSELIFNLNVLNEQQSKTLELSLQPEDSFSSHYQKALKTLFKTELAAAIKEAKNSKEKTAQEKAFLKSLIAVDIQYTHRHYVTDNEYIPYGQAIAEFLQREIAKPIIRWEDSPQLGYEILPNKYFYHYEAPKPTTTLLAEFWQLEKEAEDILKGMEA